MHNLAWDTQRVEDFFIHGVQVLILHIFYAMLKTKAKQNCFPRDLTLSVYYFLYTV